MKKIHLLILLVYCTYNASAQSWNITGNSGLTNSNFLGTTDNKDLIFKTKNTEWGRLMKTGFWRLGSSTNYVRIDSTGKLMFIGAASYQVANNKYVFQSNSNPKYGLFFNASAPQYEFRDGGANPVFYVNADNGNGTFAGNLKIGAYTLPKVDGTNGQVLTTDGAGNVSWAAAGAAAKGANKTLSNLAAVTTINASLLPQTDNSVDIGAPGAGWRDIYLDGRIFLNGTSFITGNNSNVGLGQYALNFNTGGSNTATGYQALYANTSGGSNTATGLQALLSNTLGSYNAVLGGQAMYFNTEGSQNLAAGVQALVSNTTGNNNAAAGIAALSGNTTGVQNTGSGAFALYTNATGSNNTALGAGADVSNGDLSNATAIGAFAVVDASNKVRIGNPSISSIGGQVGWTTFSDGRYKRNIKEDVKGLAFINALRPVTYTLDLHAVDEYYNSKKSINRDTMKLKAPIANVNTATAGSNTVHTGLIAQEVEAAAKKLNYDFDGVDKPQTDNGVYGLRYDEFVVPLIKAVQELSKRNDEKQQEMDSLTQNNSTLSARIESQQKQINELKQLVLQIQHAQQACSPCSASEVSGSTQQYDATIADAAALEQNVPNPFSSTTTIGYTLPQKFSSARMIITDKNGKQLKQFNLYNSGKGNIHLDASTLASGAYHYNLYINGKLIAGRQMISAK